jgi:hypothetical protein
MCDRAVTNALGAHNFIMKDGDAAVSRRCVKRKNDHNDMNLEERTP